MAKTPNKSRNKIATFVRRVFFPTKAVKGDGSRVTERTTAEPNKPIHVRHPLPELGPAIEAYLKSAIASGNSQSTWVEGDGIQVCLRIGVRNAPYIGAGMPAAMTSAFTSNASKPMKDLLDLTSGGAMAMFLTLDVVNLLMPDKTRRQGILPAVLDLLEKKVFASQPLKFVSRRFGLANPPTAVAGLLVETIQNPDLVAYLRERRQRPKWLYEPYANSPLEMRMNSGSPTYLALRPDAAKLAVSVKV